MTPLCSFLSPSMAVKESSKELVRPARDQVHHRTQQHRTTELHAEECARARARTPSCAARSLSWHLEVYIFLSLPSQGEHKSSSTPRAASCRRSTMTRRWRSARCCLRRRCGRAAGLSRCAHAVVVESSNLSHQGAVLVLRAVLPQGLLPSPPPCARSMLQRPNL